MRIIGIMLAAFLAIGADAPDTDPLVWTQDRLDRILIMANRAPGSAKLTLTDNNELLIDQPADKVALPRAVLAMAPSAEAVEGVLAMLVAYQQPVTSDGRHVESGSGQQVSGLITLSGSAADDERAGADRNGAGGPGAPPDNSPRAKAWRGARWHHMAGNCEAAQIEFIRTLSKDGRATVDGRDVTWLGSSFANRVIRDLGAQAYPGAQRCRTRSEPGFATVQDAVRGTESVAQADGQ